MGAASAELRVSAKLGSVLRDFCARRSALIEALTEDVDQFFDKCDPRVEGLCLYGDTDGRWRVAPPPEDIPPDLPEPVQGINFARDGMSRGNWLDFVAHCSDLWSLSLAFHEGTSSGFRKKHRKLLHKKMEQLPQILEVATTRRNARAQVERVSNDFTSRRRALIRALIDDAYEFYRQCNPRDTEGQWKVGPRAEDVPADLPQPVRGINLFRDSAPPRIWLFRVARSSDNWFRSVTSFEVADIELHRVDRQWLDDMIEQLSTLYEVVDIHYF